MVIDSLDMDSKEEPDGQVDNYSDIAEVEDNIAEGSAYLHFQIALDSLLNQDIDWVVEVFHMDQSCLVEEECLLPFHLQIIRE